VPRGPCRRALCRGVRFTGTLVAKATSSRGLLSWDPVTGFVSDGTLSRGPCPGELVTMNMPRRPRDWDPVRVPPSRERRFERQSRPPAALLGTLRGRRRTTRISSGGVLGNGSPRASLSRMQLYASSRRSCGRTSTRALDWSLISMNCGTSRLGGRLRGLGFGLEGSIRSLGGLSRC